jgi:hypothetical protein
MFQKNLENLKRLFLEPNLETLLVQFPAGRIQLKDTEANDLLGWREVVHECDTPEGSEKCITKKKRETRQVPLLQWIRGINRKSRGNR